MNYLRYFLLAGVVSANYLRGDPVKECVRECFNGSFPLILKAETESENFKNFINCWIQPWYPNDDDPAENENSRLPVLTRRKEHSSIEFCKTTTTGKDQWCQFDGKTNALSFTEKKPQWWYNCGAKTCDAFLVAREVYQIDCLRDLFAVVAE